MQNICKDNGIFTLRKIDKLLMVLFKRENLLACNIKCNSHVLITLHGYLCKKGSLKK